MIMKKIIFFSKNLNIGGMEKALVTLVNRLSAKYEVTLVLEEKTGTLLKDLSKDIIVKEYKMSTSNNIFLRKMYNFVKRKLWSIKNRNKYDFSCNFATYSIIGSKLAQATSKNSNFYVHSNYYDLYEGDEEAIKNFFGPHNLENYNRLIFVSNESRKKIVDIYPSYKGKSIVINNLIPYNEIVALAKEKGIMDPKKINLLFVGRLENESKNFDLLLKSFFKVYSVNKNYRLYILGTGKYKETIEELIEHYGLASSVILLGERKNPYPQMKECDAIIFTSNYEGYPVTYMEALVLNKKILTTVIVSDGIIDMERYAISMERNSNDIAQKILKNVSKKTNKSYDLNFEQIEDQIIKMIEKIIEV